MAATAWWRRDDIAAVHSACWCKDCRFCKLYTIITGRNQLYFLVRHGSAVVNSYLYSYSQKWNLPNTYKAYHLDDKEIYNTDDMMTKGEVVLDGVLKFKKKTLFDKNAKGSPDPLASLATSLHSFLKKRRGK